MLQRFWKWLHNVPYGDPVQQRLVPLVQLLLLFMVVTVVAAIIANVFLFGAAALTPSGLAPNTLFALAMLGILFLIRNGGYYTALWLIIVAILLGQAQSVYTTGLRGYGEVLLFSFIPVSLAGMLISRPALLVTFLVNVGLVITLSIVAQDNPNAVEAGSGLNAKLTIFVLTLGVFGLLLDLFGLALRSALRQAIEREQELERLSVGLERQSFDLNSANEQLRVTLSSIGDAVITTDATGHVRFLNPIAEQLTGWSLQDAQGTPLNKVFNIINEYTREPVENPVTKVLREGTVVGLANHTILISRDGREVPVDDSGAPIRRRRGDIEGVILVFRDVTERKRAEEERERVYEAEREARQRAEEANQLKIKFLGMISHELRTPLTSIKGYASTILAEDVRFPPEEERQFVRIIDEEADRLAGLVDQLLDLSRIQSNMLPLKPERWTLAEIVESARTQFDRLTVAHPLTLDLPPDLPPVIADQERIAQVLVNLVGNAAKFAPAGTGITVSARRVDDMVQVDVRDEGPGIPPESREQVFEAFRQLDKTTTRRGAGLGLAICKGLVERHGGRIWIVPVEHGAIISFTLPIAL
jgi:PAS domain S-box-containing protein